MCRPTRLVAGALIAMVLAGCSTSADPSAAGPVDPAASVAAAKSPSTAAPSSSGDAASSSGAVTAVATRCGPPDVAARTFTVSTSDQERLAAVEVGTGRRGVVLVPELGTANLCGWWDYAVYLARHGLHMLLFDHRCTGESTCSPTDRPDGLMLDIAAAIAQLKRDGSTKVALMGASQGAAEVLIAGSLTLPVAGIVALSADELDEDLATRPYASTATTAGPRIRVPALIAVGAYDPAVTVADTKALAATVPGSRLTVVPKSFAHGWDLLDTSEAGARPAISDEVVAFLRSVLR